MFWRRGSGNVDCLVSSVVVDLRCCSVPWGVGLSRFRVGCAWRSLVLWIRILLCMQECRSVDLRWGRSRDCCLWCLLPFGEGRSRGWCRWCLLGVVLELDFVVGGGSVVVRGPVRRSSCANRHFGDRAVGERCRLVVFESGEMRAPDGDLQLYQFHDLHISNTSRSGCYIPLRSVYFFPLPSFRHLESAVLQRHREASPGRSVSRSHCWSPPPNHSTFTHIHPTYKQVCQEHIVYRINSRVTWDIHQRLYLTPHVRVQQHISRHPPTEAYNATFHHSMVFTILVTRSRFSSKH